MTTVAFTEEAEFDVKDAADWYELQVAGLGTRFLSAIDHAVARIEENPLQFPRVRRDTQRTLVKRFPYALYFRIEAERAIVVGCFHGHRSPRSWQRRK